MTDQMTQNYINVTEPIVRISGFSDVSHILLGSRYGEWQTSCGLMLTFTLHGTNPVYSVEAGVATCRKCLPCSVCGTEGTQTTLNDDGNEICRECYDTTLQAAK